MPIDMTKFTLREPDPALPRHIAMIMDGNGRWARRRALGHLAGHRAGAETVRRMVEVCAEFRIPFLTLYAFSTENWNRPPEEVKGLMELLKQFLRERRSEIRKHELRLNAVGTLDRLPDDVRKVLETVIDETRENTKGVLTLALSYGSRAEITRAVQQITQKAVNGEIAPEDIDEQVVTTHLDTADLPDPDLLIRTAGEMRLSNFLLWQLSYAELWVTKTLWPDFDKEEFRAALEDYRGRERRFGGRPCSNDG